MSNVVGKLMEGRAGSLSTSAASVEPCLNAKEQMTIGQIEYQKPMQAKQKRTQSQNSQATELKQLERIQSWSMMKRTLMMWLRSWLKQAQTPQQLVRPTGVPK